MKFWPFARKKKPRRLILSSIESVVSPSLKAALEQAAKAPLDDLTFRIVAAYAHTRFISDVTLFRMGSLFDSYQRRGISESRSGAAELLALSVEDQRPPDEIFGYAALAFFDREFTVGVNQGKTHATAWNTLTLDVQLAADEIRVNRGACRIDYPIGPIDLSLLRGDLFNR